jgi:tyrosyl-tRNA synthetase
MKKESIISLPAITFCFLKSLDSNLQMKEYYLMKKVKCKEKVSLTTKIESSQFLNGKFLIAQKGKKNYVIVEIIS